MRGAVGCWRRGSAAVLGCALALASCLPHNSAADQPVVATTLAKSNVIFPIGSRKEIPVTVPEEGKLYVTMHVQRGETLAVRLIDQKDYGNYLSGREYRSMPEFDATYVRDYKRVSRVKPGNYYLVIFDPTGSDAAKHPFNDVNFRVFVLHAQHTQ